MLLFHQSPPTPPPSIPEIPLSQDLYWFPDLLEEEGTEETDFDYQEEH